LRGKKRREGEKRRPPLFLLTHQGRAIPLLLLLPSVDAQGGKRFIEKGKDLKVHTYCGAGR